MEVWWIAPDGSVQDAYWYDGASPPWTQFQLAPPGSASLYAGITAVSRIPTSMEVWWIGLSGSVEDAYWYDGASPPWTQFQLAPPGRASNTGGITAVSRIPTSMEVWWTGISGSVWDAYWYDGQPWHTFQLGGPGSASVTGGITAVSRIPESMEVWSPDASGAVQDENWYPPTPQISVSITETQIGPDICISGKNFTANGRVEISYQNIPHQGSYSVGFANVGPNQAFSLMDRSQEGGLVFCSDSDSSQQVSILARDSGSGQTVSTTVPGAYWCVNVLVPPDYNGGCH
jgi:hypothetical protein